MKLALFDLDNTLLNGDSDAAWANYLIEQSILDPIAHKLENDRFYSDYLNGTLDIHAWLNFQLTPLTLLPLEKLYKLRNDFINRIIRPIILEEGLKAIEHHRNQGDKLVIVTATNDFVTEPIAQLLGITQLIATQAEKTNEGRYTGKAFGTPAFREGKITRLNQWLATQNQTLADYTDTWFYSDSHNDIPLLSLVRNPVAVNPDEKLLQHARTLKWQIADFKKVGITL
ncbi:MAG: HAD family hydrolase [Pseudomonadota bacterium]